MHNNFMNSTIRKREYGITHIQNIDFAALSNSIIFTNKHTKIYYTDITQDLQGATRPH